MEQFKREQETRFKVTEEVCSEPPTARTGASLTAHPISHNELILFGGEFFNGQKCVFYNDLYRYNHDKNEWRRITSPNSPGPRSSHQAVATPTGKLFLFGGEFASANETQFFHYKDFWLLDLRTNQWERLDHKLKPHPRSGHRMILWKHFLILFGGFYDTFRETKYFDDLWIFDINENKWIKIEPFPPMLPKPSARSAFQMFVHNDILYIYGGYTKITAQGQKTKGFVHTDMWTMKLSPDLKNMHWERKKRYALSPS